MSNKIEYITANTFQELNIKVDELSNTLKEKASTININDLNRLNKLYENKENLIASIDEFKNYLLEEN